MLTVALLTGRHPVSTGITRILPGSRTSPGLGQDQQTMASMLRGTGYATGMFGKWHLGVTPECRPTAPGFDEFFGFLAGCIDYYSHIFCWGQGGGVDPVHDLWSGDTEVWRNGEYVTEVITDHAVEFIDRNAQKLTLNPCIDLDQALPDETFLVDLDDDPTESVNQREQRPDLVAELRDDLVRWSGSLLPAE